MSFQKAYKFCKLCHEYAAHANGGAHALETEWYRMRDGATNETMSALHHVLGDKSGIFEKDEKKLAGERLLGECARCNYSSPRVADLVAEKVLDNL